MVTILIVTFGVPLQARVFTDLENHRYSRDYEEALIYKVIPMYLPLWCAVYICPRLLPVFLAFLQRFDPI